MCVPSEYVWVPYFYVPPKGSSLKLVSPPPPSYHATNPSLNHPWLTLNILFESVDFWENKSLSIGGKVAACVNPNAYRL